MKPSRAKAPVRVTAARTPLASMRTPISVRSARTPSVQPRRQISREEAEKDPVEVFCRLRPGSDESCVNVCSDSKVQLVPPTSSKSYSSGKELQCSFKCKYLIFNSWNLFYVKLISTFTYLRPHYFRCLWSRVNSRKCVWQSRTSPGQWCSPRQEWALVHVWSNGIWEDPHHARNK